MEEADDGSKVITVSTAAGTGGKKHTELKAPCYVMRSPLKRAMVKQPAATGLNLMYPGGFQPWACRWQPLPKAALFPSPLRGGAG